MATFKPLSLLWFPRVWVLSEEGVLLLGSVYRVLSQITYMRLLYVYTYGVDWGPLKWRNVSFCLDTTSQALTPGCNGPSPPRNSTIVSPNTVTEEPSKFHFLRQGLSV